MGMTAAKPGKRFLKFVRRNISGQMHALLRLLLFGRFLDSLLIFIESDPAASPKTSRTGILTLSQRSKRHLPHGVNRPEVREAKLITDHFGLEKNSYILFLGRLVPEKGIRYLVEAFKNIKTDKKLVIAGGSSDTDSFMEELKDLAKGDDRILFTGFVQGAMLDELYSNAYIYTLPSDLEGMPLSLLEAMSYGNCCLVSDIPECAEVVEDKA